MPPTSIEQLVQWMLTIEDYTAELDAPSEGVRNHQGVRTDARANQLRAQVDELKQKIRDANLHAAYQTLLTAQILGYLRL